MPIFEYKALTSSGKTKKGIVDADTARDARSKLRSDHMHVTEMWEVADKKSKKDKSVSKKTRSLPAKKGKPGGLLSKEIELFHP